MHITVGTTWNHPLMKKFTYDPASAAEAGALFLDAVHPGWAKQINTADLDLNKETRCVLGQLYGTFTKGVKALKLTLGARQNVSLGGSAAALGFTMPDEAVSDHPTTVSLTRAWLQPIAARMPTKRFRIIDAAGAEYTMEARSITEVA